MRVVFCDKCGCERKNYDTDRRWFNRFDLCLDCENKLGEFFDEVWGLDDEEMAELLRQKRQKREKVVPQGVDGASAEALKKVSFSFDGRIG